MMSIYKYLCFLLLMSSLGNLQAQSKHKEFIYRYSSQGDSAITLQKERHFNADSALIYKKHYMYEGNFQQNALWREESAVLVDNVLTQMNIFYRKNAEPTTEKLETKYLVYSAHDSIDKIVWMKKYDTNNELIRQDSIVYDKKMQAIEKWSHIFTGSTSVTLEKYKYKKGNLAQTQFYIVWNTVNIRGNATAKRSKRGTYKYKYNKKGQLVSGKGKIRNTNYLELNTYDAQNKIASETITFKYQEKYINEQKQAIMKDMVDSTRRNYKDGLLVEEYVQTRNQIKSRLVNTYQDGLLVESQIYSTDNKLQKIIKHTVANKQYTSGMIEHYDGKDKLLFRTALSYNDKGLLVEEKMMGLTSNSIVSVKQYTYDNFNRLIDIITINGKEEKTERTVFEYF